MTADDPDQVRAAITERTRMLISESPTNPHLSIVDVQRFAELGRRHQIETLIDATLATPYNLRPLDFASRAITRSTTASVVQFGKARLRVNVNPGAKNPEKRWFFWPKPGCTDCQTHITLCP